MTSSTSFAATGLANRSGQTDNTWWDVFVSYTFWGLDLAATHRLEIAVLLVVAVIFAILYVKRAMEQRGSARTTQQAREQKRKNKAAFQQMAVASVAHAAVARSANCQRQPTTPGSAMQQQQQRHMIGASLIGYLSAKGREKGRHSSSVERSRQMAPRALSARRSRAESRGMAVGEAGVDVVRPRCDVLLVFPMLEDGGASNRSYERLEEDDEEAATEGPQSSLQDKEDERQRYLEIIHDRLFVEAGPDLETSGACCFKRPSARTWRLSTRHAASGRGGGRSSMVHAPSSAAAVAAAAEGAESMMVSNSSTFIPLCCQESEQEADRVERRLQTFDERLLPTFDEERASSLPRQSASRGQELADLLKEDRVQRLLRRLATRDRLNKRVQRVRSGGGGNGGGGNGGGEAGGGEHPFAYAPRDEWISEGTAELFTSMERVHLIKLLLEAPLDEGGCEIDLLEAEKGGLLRVVPVHDGSRTCTVSYPDDDDPEKIAAVAERGGGGGAVAAAGGEGGEGKAPLSVGLRRLQSAGLQQVALNTLAQIRRGHKLTSSDDPEGTLIKSWYRQRLSLLPDQPLDEIRDYFGEEVALYFLFLQHLASWQFIPGSIGLVPIAGWVYYGTMDNWLSSVYSVVVLIWCYCFLKYWERHRRKWAYKWNVEHSREEERMRPQFREEANKEEEASEKRLGLYSKEGDYIEIDSDDQVFQDERRWATLFLLSS